MRLLTVDLGNTRCKLRLLGPGGADGDAEVERTALPTGPGTAAAVRDWLRARPRPDAAAMCAVGSAEVETEVGRVLREVATGPVELRPWHGLDVAVREPDRVGLDRLFAARGALELAPRGAIVVDAGTALTVDAVRGSREFLGGAIAPGPDLLGAALAQGTARLPRVAPDAGARALGRDTAEAISAGIRHGFRGAARELAARVAAESGLGAVPVLLTGGALGFLLDPPVLDAGEVRVEPDLVHLGLAAVLREAVGADGGRR